MQDYTFKNLYEQYLSYCSTRLKKSTMKQKIYKFSLMKDLYELSITEISNSVIETWMDEILKDSTKKYINSLIKELRAFYNWCIDNRYVTFNTAKSVDLYPVKKNKQPFWEWETYKEFIKLVDNEDDKLKFNILFYTGIRSGELTALTPKKFDCGKMIVDETYNPQTKEVAGTKNSVYITYLPDFLWNDIVEYIEKYNIQDTEFLFPRNSAWYLRKVLKQICLEHNIRPIKLHGLRHSCVSLLLNSGFEILEVSRYIGHSEPSITWETYSHMYNKKMNLIKKHLEEIHNKG